MISTSAEGNVLIGVDTPTAPVLADRAQGIKQEFQRLRPQLHIVGPFNSQQVTQAHLVAWNQAINRDRPLRRFKDTLLDFPEVRQQWFDFQKQAEEQAARDWLESIGVEPLPFDRKKP